MNATTNSKASVREIVVRSLRDGGRVEWAESAKSWPGAWRIVRGAFATHKQCKVYAVTETTWVIDIQEAA